MKEISKEKLKIGTIGYAVILTPEYKHSQVKKVKVKEFIKGTPYFYVEMLEGRYKDKKVVFSCSKKRFWKMEDDIKIDRTNWK